MTAYYEALVLAAYALIVADVVLTRRVVQAGGRELNPVIRWAIGSFGLTTGLVLGKVPAILALYFIRDWQLPATACVIYSAVVAWNAYQWRKSAH